MGTTWTIAKREFGAFFKSPIAYIVLVALVGWTGYLFFWGNLFIARQASMDAFFSGFPLWLILVCPAIAMRLLSEERGTGTIEMLLTMPVRDSEVVLGKYLAAVATLGVGLLCTVPFAFTVSRLGNLDLGPVITGYLGALLIGGMYLAVGMLASAMTRHQIVAFVVGLALCGGLFLLYVFFQMAGPVVGPILQLASPPYHFSKMARGVIELRNLVYFFSIIGVLLVLSIQVLESRKWR
jgi:ABC-2 type transport system permease protein